MVADFLSNPELLQAEVQRRQGVEAYTQESLDRSLAEVERQDKEAKPRRGEPSGW